MTNPSLLPKSVRRVFDEMWTLHCPELVPEFFGDDFRLVLSNGSHLTRAQFQEAVGVWLAAFPDIHFTVERSLALENEVTVYWRGKGTHRGRFMNITPTGRRIDYTGMTWFDLKDGLIVTAHVESDMMALLGSLTDGDAALTDFRSDLDKYDPADYALDGRWSVNIHGAAKAIYELVIKCRTVPSSNRMLVEALRQGFTMKEVPGAPELITPRELMDDVSVEEKMVPGPRGDIRLLVYKASNAMPLAPIFLYIHGGGFCMEKPEDAELVTRKFAWMSGAAVISVDYRLAPEHPYPCGLDDCVAAFVWLRQNANRWGLDPERIVVGGDSAGGNLGPALTLRMRDEGKVRPPEGTLMLCPWTDMICERYASFRRNGPKGVIYDSAFCGYVRSMYSPSWLWTHPYVSPMWANLDGFGPAFILAAGHDLLADENRVFHEKLLAAGNPSEFLQHDNMPHAYYYFLGLAPEIEEAYAAMVNWLRNVLSISWG